MTNFFIHPYKAGSGSARALADGLEGRRILTNGKSKYQYRKTHKVINWGSSKSFVPEGTPMINNPQAVATASNKLSFFRAMDGLSYVVPWTDDIAKASSWLEEGSIIVCRHRLQGHSGDGIQIIDPEDEKTLDIPEVPLYTKYVKKAFEYRIHVMNGQVIDIQRKILRPNINPKETDVNWQIRNHDNGFIYIRTDNDQPIEPQAGVREAAIETVSQLGLDFGAVDVIYNNRKNKPFVLEVNTSPGLEGQTVENYVNAFRQHYA